MSSRHDVPSPEDVLPAGNLLTQPDRVAPSVRRGQVRSNPDATVRQQALALGLDNTFPQVNRPNFASSDNIARAHNLLVSDAQSDQVRSLTPILQTMSDRRQDSITAAPTNTAETSRASSLRHPTPGLREAILGSPDIVTAMAVLERRSRPLDFDENEEPFSFLDCYESSVDDPITFPALPSVGRRRSDPLEIQDPGGGHRDKYSLPDLRKIKTTFNRVANLEGTTDPELILQILNSNPEIDNLYMSPTLPPWHPNFSPYVMQLVHPLNVDLLNLCVVSRKNVMRYIKGKQPRSLTLRRWAFEQNVIMKMRKKSFFKNFKLIKAFSALGRHLDMSNFGKTRRKLRTVLMTCNPVFAEALLLVRTMCLDISALSMIRVDAELTYTLGEFLEEQEQLAQEIASRMERCLSVIVQLVARACWDDVIGAGLAEEGKEKRGATPYRVNEIRKYPRIKQTPPSSVARRIPDDVTPGVWIRTENPQLAQETEGQRRERCCRLCRLIYLVDLMIRDALYEILVSSLKISAIFLQMHLETFPRDEDIVALVRGYVKDLDSPGLFAKNDNDDDDDGNNGGGQTGGKTPDMDGDIKGQSNVNPAAGSGQNGQPRGQAPTANPATPGTASGRQVAATATSSRSRPNTETELTTTWTTMNMSSSVERLGLDTTALASPSTMEDNALYSSGTGETDLTDSMDASTSTMSEDNENLNPLGAPEPLMLLRDHAVVPDVVGAAMRVLGLYNQPDEYNREFVSSVPGSQPERGTSIDHDADPDDITVIEQHGHGSQEHSVFQDSHTPVCRKSSGQGVHADVKNVHFPETDEDLTITSDEKSSPAHHPKSARSNTVSVSASPLTSSSCYSKRSFMESGGQNRNCPNILNPKVQQFMNTNNIVASVTVSHALNRHDFGSRRSAEGSLRTLLEKGEIYNSDSSDSLYVLNSDSSWSVKETKSLLDVLEEKTGQETLQPASGVLAQLEEMNKDNPKEAKVIEVTNEKSVEILDVEHRNEASSVVSESPISNAELHQASKGSSDLGTKMCPRDSPEPFKEKSSHDLNDDPLSPSEHSPRCQSHNSSAGFQKDYQEKIFQSFPIKEKRSWMSAYIENYVNIRRIPSSSVDDNNLTPAIPSSVTPAQDHEDDSVEVVIRARKVSTSELKAESDDMSEEELSHSCNSRDGPCGFCSFGDKKEDNSRDKNYCHQRSLEDYPADPKTNENNEGKTPAENTPEANSDESEEMIMKDQMNALVTNQIDNLNVALLDNNATLEAITKSLDKEKPSYFLDDRDSIYFNSNTSPMDDEDDTKFSAADFFLNEETDMEWAAPVQKTSVNDLPGCALSRSPTSLVRKDGGKRKKGQSNQNATDASLQNASSSAASRLKESIANPPIPKTEPVTASPIEKSPKKTKAASSYSSPSVLSESSGFAQLTNILPEALPVLVKLQKNREPAPDGSTDHPRFSHGHNVHFNSMNSSFAKTESECSLALTEDDPELVRASTFDLARTTPILENTEEEEMMDPGELYTEDEVQEQKYSLEEDALRKEEFSTEEMQRQEDNKTENDLTDGLLESTTETDLDVHSAALGLVEGAQRIYGTEEIIDHGRKEEDQLQGSTEGRKLEEKDGTGGSSGGKGGGSGGGGGGGGSGGGGGLPTPGKKKLTADLKPMFHASVSIDRDKVCISPDVYDLSAACFNVIQDIELRLVSTEKLISHPAFIPFTHPSSDGQTSVNKLPRGPGLDRVVRYDPHVVSLKNSIYGSIDSMFHSVGVFLREMEKLYRKYFQDKRVDFDTGSRDMTFYFQQLQRHDVTLKIADRIPESQRLGMFLLDLNPYKEFVRQTSLADLQHLHLEINADVVRRTRKLVEKLNELHNCLESQPTTLMPLFQRLTSMDSCEDTLQELERGEISHIGAMYDLIDRFDVPYTEMDRRGFETTHYLVTSIRHVAELSLQEREQVVEAIDRCLSRDVHYLAAQVKKVMKPLVEAEELLDGRADPTVIKQTLADTEQVVKTHVAMADFVKDVQRYLSRPVTPFTELYHLSARYVNTRNLWLLMTDWDAKLDRWKHQSFQSLDIQEINSCTFRYMEACDKLEKLLPKNTVVQVFEEKMDVMLRWLNFIIEFRGQAVKPRHWTQIEEILGVSFNEQLPLTLASLMSINAIEKQKSLHGILNKARAESNVQNEFDEVCHQCRSLNLPIQTRQKALVDGEGQLSITLLADTFEIEESLNYFVMELERIELSPHSGFLHNAMEQFVQSIFEALEKLVQWMEMQMKLSRLRRLVFRHPEVMTTLPAEVERYKQIYLNYSQFMTTVQSDPNVMKWCLSEELQGVSENYQDEIVRLYRTFKRDIDSRGGQDGGQQDVQQQFGAWVIM